MNPSGTPPIVSALPLPEGPFFLIAKVSEVWDPDDLNTMLLSLEAEMQVETGQRGRVIALAGDITLETLGDEDLARLGLRRIGNPPR